jgi:molecular chaperone HtpG
MAKKQFKAESKRLLDLMINSIYTHKEIFLRELISNASDAMDKLYYRSLETGTTGVNREGLSIRIELDKEQRKLSLSDNGIGMTKEEMEDNLGIIARSGSLLFKNETEEQKTVDGQTGKKTDSTPTDIDIIGQFGVGFYSAFMVSDMVQVISRALGSETAFLWESSGADGYSIKETTKEEVGTDIILTIKKSTEEEDYDQYLTEYRIRELVGRYSDYIRYPIQMMVENRRPIGEPEEGKMPEFETFMELTTLNSMIPVWKKQKKELKDGEYNEFYKDKFHDFTDPAKVIRTSVEGVSSYTALLFIPGRPAYNYYSRDYEKGLQLYSSGVLIMDKCAELLPDYFSFVRGLVDSQDLSLNISREMLQHDRQLRAISERLEKKIKAELLTMLKSDREGYEAFYKNFGLQLKYGLYDKFGANADSLKDLILFYSSSEKKPVSFAEYVSRMPEAQKYIYYAVGGSVEKADQLPQTDILKEKGYEILYLTEDVDEFALQALREYEGKSFRSVSSGELDLIETEEEKEETQKQEEESKALLDHMKAHLGDKVAEVRLSRRLKQHPVCLSAKGGLSLEMEQVLKAMPMEEEIKAERVLEINAGHHIMQVLAEALEKDESKLDKYTDLLYNQAMLMAGYELEDPAGFGNAIVELMI